MDPDNIYTNSIWNTAHTPTVLYSTNTLGNRDEIVYLRNNGYTTTGTYNFTYLYNGYTYRGTDLSISYDEEYPGYISKWTYNPHWDFKIQFPYMTQFDMPQDTAVDAKRREIKSNLTIIIKSRTQELKNIPTNEWVAMQTLREMVTEAEFRKYLKDGFITIKGQSGKVYQIFRNRPHTKVYEQGKLIEEICVRLDYSIPATDSVIAFKTMIETDEELFASLGNRYNMQKAA
jgi:hypothetical protein